MITNFSSGEIWKGSNAEISVMLFPRCYQRKGEITDVSLTFYTTVGGSAITFSGSSVTVSGNSAIVVFQPIQLDVLDDGLLRYHVSLNDDGEPKVFNLETRFIIKTPLDYEPVDYVTHDEVEGLVEEYVEEVMADYYTSAQTDSAIETAMAQETARTENTYLKEHQSLADYYTSAQTDSAIETAIEGITGGTTSAETEQLIEQAMTAETARTEQTYLKEVPIATTATTGVVKVGSGLTVDSGGTLASNLVPVYILKDQNEQYYIDIFNYVSNNSGNTGFVFYLENDHYGEPGWFESTIWQWGTQHTELWLTFYYGLVNPAHSVWILNSSGEFYTYAEGEMLTNLPVASSNTLGGIKVGSGLTIQEDGTLSAEGGGTVPVATTGSTGVVKVGSGLTIDSGGTLSQEVISIDLANKSQSELAAIQQFVSGHTNDYRFQFTWLIPGDNPTWATSVDYGVDGNDGSIYLTFLNRSGVSWWGYLQPSGTMQYLGSGQYVTKPDSTDYSLFNKNLHLSSGGTLYFDDTEVDSGGAYDNILTEWGSLIFVGAYGMLKDVTGPFDHPICPLYVDSSSTDSGRTLALPKVIDEPTDGTIIHNGEVADHKITLDYGDYKISYYCGGSHHWIVGLSITPIETTEELISQAMAQETARTENTYLKEHQSLTNYYTSAQTNSAIETAMAAETARTEQTYLKEHQSLADYYTSAQTNSAIESAMAAETARTEQTYLKEHQSLANYYTSAQTNSAIETAMAAETARTEQTYLKEHQSLANYYTSAQTNSAITTAVQDKVSSATITQIWTGTQAQYNAMSAHTNNILYFING